MKSFKASFKTNDGEVLSSTVVIAETETEALVKSVHFFHTVQHYNVDSTNISLERINDRNGEELFLRKGEK